MTVISRIHNVVPAAALIAGVIAAGNAVAQSQAVSSTDSSSSSAAAGGLEEVTVTARFQKESLEQTPIAITALTGEQLEARGMTNILDVARSAPNVVLQVQQPQYGKSISAFIRGVGQNDFNFALEPGVAFYVDDVYFGTAFGSIFDLLDLQRVEVLRGPQGTLFGKNSEGGAVRLVSVKPQGDGSGYAEATIGSFNRRKLRGGLDVAVMDNVFLRISGAANKSDGYFTRYDYACLHPDTAGNLRPTTTNPDCKIGEEGGDDVISLRAALRWLPSDALEFNLVFDRVDDTGQPTPNKTIRTIPDFQGSPLAGYNGSVLIPIYGIPNDSRFITNSNYSSYAVFGNPLTGLTYPDRSTVHSWGTSLTADWQLAQSLHVKSISSYRDYNGDWVFSADNTPLTLNLNYNTVKHRQFSQELQLSGVSFADKLDWTVGAFYYDAFSHNGGNIDVAVAQIGPLGNGLNFNVDYPVYSKSKSVFAHGVLHITEKFSLEAGVRYGKDDKSYTFSRYLPNLHAANSTLPGNAYPLNRPGLGLGGVPWGYLGTSDLGGLQFPVTTIRSDSSRVDPKVGLQYQWTSDLMTYVQYSTGYKGGGANPRPLGPAQIVPLKPEELRAYELGLKSQWFERRLQVNAAAFVSKYKNLQQQSYGTDNTGLTAIMYGNVGKARITGAELEVQVTPVSRLLLDASLGYLRYKTLDLGSAANIPNGPTLATVPVNTPSWKGDMGVQYTLGNSSTYGEFTPRIDYSFQTETFNDLPNRPEGRQGGYGIANARITWDAAGTPWTVVAAVNNMFDKFYFDSESVGLAVFGVQQGTPSMPRTWSVSVKRTFK
jgi:iron complex outermembrane recepter protein